MTNTRHLPGRIALTAALGLGASLGGLLITRPAWAHTPEVTASCSSGKATGHVDLTQYAGQGNTVAINGGAAIPFGSSYHSGAIDLGDPSAPHTLTAVVTSSDGQGGGTFTASSVACVTATTTTPDTAPPTTETPATDAPAEPTTTVTEAPATSAPTATAPPINGPADVVGQPPAPSETCLDLGNGHSQYRYSLGDCTPPCTPAYTPTGELAGVCTPPAAVAVASPPAPPATPTAPVGTTLPSTGSHSAVSVLPWAALVLFAGLGIVGVSRRKVWRIRRPA